MKSMQAMQSMKAMKSVNAKSAMKASAASSPSMKIMKVMKKPSKQDGKQQACGSTGLTEEALASLEGASDSKVDKFLDGLAGNDQNYLWKKFERNRIVEGTQNEYQEHTSGMGAREKRNSLLKVWLQGGQSTKNSLWQESFFKIKSIRSHGTKETWQPLHYMLTHKYGKAELKARVEAGTIKIRASPEDARFPEFCEVNNFTEKRTTRSGEIGIKPKDQKIEWNDFERLQNLEVSGDDQVAWGNGPPPEKVDPFALTGWGNKGKKSISDDKTSDPSPSPPRGVSRGNSCDFGSQAKSVASQILANLANCESLAAKKSPEDSRKALVKVRGTVSKIHSDLEEAFMDKPKNKKLSQAIKEVATVAACLRKKGVDKLSPGQLEKLVSKSAKVCKKHSNLLEDED